MTPVAAAPPGSPTRRAPRGGILRYPIDLLPVAVSLLGLGACVAALDGEVTSPAFWGWVALSIPLRLVASAHHHCHAHLATFRSPALNFAYDQILALLGGYTTPGWELQHGFGHHGHLLDPARDPASTARFGGEGPLGRLRFTLLGDALAHLDAWRLAPEAQALGGWRRPRRRLALHLCLQGALLAGMLLLAPLQAAILFILITRLIRWGVFWGSWGQHHGAPLTHVYDGALTHLGPLNRLLLNVGHHTAHHERPTLHWSLLPQRTARILHRIPPACVRGA